jgi:hypothetical protein
MRGYKTEEFIMLIWVVLAVSILLPSSLRAQSNPGFQNDHIICADSTSPSCTDTTNPGLNQVFMMKADVGGGGVSVSVPNTWTAIQTFAAGIVVNQSVPVGVDLLSGTFTTAAIRTPGGFVVDGTGQVSAPKVVLPSNGSVSFGNVLLNAASSASAINITLPAVTGSTIIYSTTVTPGTGSCPSGTVGGKTVAGCFIASVNSVAQSVPYF